MESMRHPVELPADAKVARRMFVIGAFALPWLWMVNCLFFYQRIYEGRDVSAEAKVWLMRSTVGAATAFAGILAWIIIVQLKWEEWGLQSLLVYTPEEDTEGDGW